MLSAIQTTCLSQLPNYTAQSPSEQRPHLHGNETGTAHTWWRLRHWNISNADQFEVSADTRRIAETEQSLLQKVCLASLVLYILLCLWQQGKQTLKFHKLCEMPSFAPYNSVFCNVCVSITPFTASLSLSRCFKQAYSSPHRFVKTLQS
jgi:hypothetical protein